MTTRYIVNVIFKQVLISKICRELITSSLDELKNEEDG